MEAASELRKMRFPAALAATSSTSALIAARMPLARWLEVQADSPETQIHLEECGDPSCTTAAALVTARKILKVIRGESDD